MGHSLKWATGSRLFGLLTQFPHFPRELVVHSQKWTTSSRLFGAFASVSALFRGANGPLERVDHWLTTFRAFGPVSALFPGASGPLDGVDHWLTTYRQLCLSFRLSPSLFKPAAGPFPSFSSTFYLELSCKKAPFRVFIYEDTFSRRKENAVCDRQLGISTFISCLVSALN